MIKNVINYKKRPNNFSDKPSIILYPGFRAYYYSFYIQGLFNMFKSINYSSEKFPSFHSHCLSFIVKENNKKIYISAGDGIGFNADGLEWCDVYAKVNIREDLIPREYSNKILPIGPSFGINYLNTFQTIYHLFKSLNSISLGSEDYLEHIKNYYQQWRYGLNLNNYKNQNVDLNYIFHASSLWKKEKETNLFRYNFMQASSKIKQIHFEGGFAPGKRELMDIPEKFILRNKFSRFDYLRKLKKSVVCFNTPAVQGCLGWKLGEYLALGKAILSTPINNMLPSPLIHGKHIHYVNGSRDSIYDGIMKIIKDIPYRLQLEQNAKEYYENYLSPKAVLNRILNHRK